jgi:predicted dienelactone hydrolase
MQVKLSFLALFLANTGAGYLLPNPPGKYNVTMTSGTVIDYNRDGRTLMLSVSQPASCTSTVPLLYMPNITAKYQGPWARKKFNLPVDLTPILLKARLPVCLDDPRSGSPLDEPPILLLSTGYRSSRLYYSVVASAIASECYMVITIDHPGETNIITYPDGHAVYSNLSNIVDLNELTPYTYARVADASFVIDQLSNATAMTEILPRHAPRHTPRHAPRQLPTDRVAMLGHSIGGAAAVLAASQDSRIRGVINWDGPFFGSLHPSGLSQPVLYVATKHDDFSSWLAIWQEFKGTKLWASSVEGSSKTRVQLHHWQQ